MDRGALQRLQPSNRSILVVHFRPRKHLSPFRALAAYWRIGATMAPAMVLLPVLLYLGSVQVQGERDFLNPALINLALGKPVVASSTCGVGDNGQPVRDLYCSLGGSLLSCLRIRRVRLMSRRQQIHVARRLSIPRFRPWRFVRSAATTSGRTGGAAQVER